MWLLYAVILCVVVGLLDWIGGEKWANTKVRDFGIPVCIGVELYLFTGFS